jgi:asparagine synthase (glutamine-hydrolysing)
MVETMQHQADSASGTLLAPELGVYCGWVAHAGSFAAHQCAAVAGPVHLLVSGEFFGPAIQQNSSICDLYQEQGDAVIAGLSGLFSGLFVDRRRGQTLLFNDRYGSERLYAFEKDGATYFASEAKALLAVLPELRAFDDTGVAQFLAFGSTIGGRTLFRGLRLVPGGSLWRTVPGTAMVRKRYFTPANWEGLPALSESEFESRFAESFRNLLPAYLRADQPVGLSLTGGLDTRMILACTPRGTEPSVAYTYAAEGGNRMLDLTIAQRVAEMRGIPHHNLNIGADFLAGFGQQLDRTVFVTDGCAGVLGAHELYLSEQARQLAPVRLTGNFGSEILRSMSTFKRNGPCDELLDPAIAVRVGSVVAEQQARAVHPVSHAAFEEVPWHLFGTLAAARSQLSFRTPYLDNQVVELAYRAPAHLRRTAAPALRLIHESDAALGAVPTDRGLAWGADGLGGQWQRLYCAATFKLDYWHKEGLPDVLTPFDTLLGTLSNTGLLGLHKFLAYRVWFRRELAPYAAQVIGDSRTRGLPFWKAGALDAVASDHALGRRNRLRDIHAVMTLEAVHRLLIDPAAYPASANA